MRPRRALRYTLAAAGLAYAAAVLALYYTARATMTGPVRGEAGLTGYHIVYYGRTIVVPSLDWVAALSPLALAAPTMLAAASILLALGTPYSPEFYQAASLSMLVSDGIAKALARILLNTLHSLRAQQQLVTTAGIITYPPVHLHINKSLHLILTFTTTEAALLYSLAAIGLLTLLPTRGT